MNTVTEHFSIKEGSCKVTFQEGNAGYMPLLTCEETSISIPLLLSTREVELTLFKLLKLKNTEKFNLDFFRNIVAGAASMSMKYKS